MYKKTAVITGASSGIGREFASQLALLGYNLIIVARNEDKLWRLAADLDKLYGARTAVIQMDLSMPGAAEAVWREISEITTDIDVLVNNAGVGDACDFADEDIRTIERMVNLNILALTQLTRLALPSMLTRQQGRILNVASLAGFQPGGPGMAVYYATKSYVLSFSRALSSELIDRRVSVTTLCPGPTASGFEDAANMQGIRLFSLKKPMSAANVASAGIEGMIRGKAVVVPGLMNKLLGMTWMVPDALSLWMNKALLRKTVG